MKQKICKKDNEIYRNEDLFSANEDLIDTPENQAIITLSRSLLNQIRFLARTEGIGLADLIVELIAEGVTKRAFENQNSAIPSHLMTRNGYVHDTAINQIYVKRRPPNNRYRK